MSAFILEITTTTSNETVVIPGTGTGYSYDIDWGDGSPEETGLTSNAPSHIYSVAGVYQVSISGTFPRVYYNNGSYKLQPTAIISWGDENTWSTDQTNAFYNCTNLIGSLPDEIGPFNTLITGILMFRGTQISGSLPSGITLGSLTNGTGMFQDTEISGSLPSGMTLDSLTNGSFMFEFAQISGSLPSGMTLSALTNGNFMFRNTQISGSLPSGMTLSALTSGSSMFNNTQIGQEFYSPLLVRMAANNPNNSVALHAGTAEYFSGDAADARATLASRGWTFTDGGENTDVDWTDGDYTISGTYEITDTYLDWQKGAGTITLAPPAATTIDLNFNGESVEDIVIDGAGTVRLTGGVLTDSFEGINGTLDVNGQDIETSPGNFVIGAGFSVTDSSQVP